MIFVHPRLGSSSCVSLFVVGALTFLSVVKIGIFLGRIERSSEAFVQRCLLSPMDGLMAMDHR
jgi:hypothetical protein